MSKDELCSMARDLYASGAIGFPDMRVLTLHPDTQAGNWPGWTHFETPGQHGDRRDWIHEIETRLAKWHEDPAYVDYQQRVLHFLKRVCAAREIVLTPPTIPATAPAAKRHYGFARGQGLPLFGRRARSLAA
jgi:hypothetical protein